jgi:3-deoxy-D-manno-octulosonic-acid transferase
MAAYRALSARKAHAPFVAPALRPKGELVWAHATNDTRLAALCDFGTRLKQQRPGLHLLITTLSGAARPAVLAGETDDWICPLGSDHPEYVRQFLDHWAPNMCIWTGGHPQFNLIGMASDRGIPMILIDADETGFEDRTSFWLPKLSKSSLGCFSTILAAGEAAADRVIRLGAPPDRVKTTNRLRSSGNPLHCNDSDVAEITETLAGRPIWLAAHLQEDEIETVLAAHRKASRLAHRLMLVLIPARDVDMDVVRAYVTASGLRSNEWSPGDIPDETAHVLISEGGESLGLWYRIAPLSFIGSSLFPGHGGRDPFNAASLGSAVLYGPNMRDHLTTYSRLAAAGAARIVKDADTLSAAVSRLIAPDHAASMALAGWEVVSEGAHLIDQVLELANDTLDQAEVR